MDWFGWGGEAWGLVGEAWLVGDDSMRLYDIYVWW